MHTLPSRAKPIHRTDMLGHPTQKLRPDIVASIAARCELSGELSVSPYVVAEEGYCIVVRALQEKTEYNQVEDVQGQFQTVKQGDVIVGVLGERRALHGYSGHVPRHVEVGDTLHLLNLGGIIGKATTPHPEYGPALAVEVLGAVVIPHGSGSRHASIKDVAIPPAEVLTDSAPLVVVSGTSMNTGKTYSACSVIEGLTERGYRVAAAKLTGAALMRDVRQMEEHGAVAYATFTDAGLASSTGKAMPAYAKGIIAHLNAAAPDVIVLEMGAGLLGYYGVDGLLQDRELQRFAAAHVVTAMNLTDAWAADRLFRERYRASITVMSGPVTDNEAGVQYIEQMLGIPAANAKKHGHSLAARVADALDAYEPLSAAFPKLSLTASAP